jgi:hypothetical protein
VDTSIYSKTAQGLVLKAQVPSNQDIQYVTAVWWKMWKGPDPYWVHRQVDIGAGQKVPGDWVTFGAPGLEALTEHRFQVAFEDQDNHVTCWSDYSTLLETVGFATTAPELPLGMAYVAEDHFNRPVTDFREDTDVPPDGRVDGDSLGPGNVWTGLGYDGEWDSKIADCDGDEKGDCAEVAQATLMKYTKHQATHEHSYTELLLELGPGSTLFNFEIESRYHEEGSVRKYYLAKVFNDNAYFSGTNLIIGRYDLQPTDYQNDPDTHVLQMPDINQAKCNEAPFSGSEPVWFRLETEDSAEGKPMVTGTLAWNCTAGNSIHDCANVCTKTWTDSENPMDMDDITGYWLFSVHHTTYYIDMFRAASKDQP